ncbi:MAG: hypothetical protein IPJ68_05990 [Candidatus Moraniibacteriota bacterium]|nr:MAG: hypothetical protein IPJ68_05990 [Candidatus Moranbacteria bacterium]
MNAIIRLVIAVLVLLGLSGCAAPQPYMGSGGYAGQTDRYSGYDPRYSRRIPPGYVNPDTPYMGLHRGRCYYLGFIQPTNDLCLSGQVTAGPANLAAYGQPSQYGTASGVAPTLGGGMSPEAAARELAELESRPNPCTSQESTLRTAIGTVIGVAAGAAITSGHNRGKGAVVGGLAGAAFGNGGASAACQRYTDARLALQAVIDAAKPRCRDELHQREVDGRLMTDKTRDCGATEVKDFDRIGQGQPTAKSQPMRMQRPPEDLPPK